VVSRRAGGLSIGINLNPDKVCNFDCPYCQVDRATPGGSARIDLERLRAELDGLLDLVAGGELWGTPPFDTAAPALRRVADLCFAGDGEPTTPAAFAAAARVVREARDEAGLAVPVRLLTNATLLHRARVREGLTFIDEPWCKLDAGTAAWFARVDGTAFPFARILANIVGLAREREIVVQSLFCAIDGVGPDDDEVAAWVGRLTDVVAAGGRLAGVQVYGVARKPASPTVTALPAERLAAIATRARAAGLPATVWV
jgi:wyosine [tRNA(Phe)-imidazoG37] synthetase (radical SAM superfamily)